VKHVREWLRENPDPNDYRVALTLREAARESRVNRALLDIAIGPGTLRAHKCGARTLILQSAAPFLASQRATVSTFVYRSEQYAAITGLPRVRRVTDHLGRVAGLRVVSVQARAGARRGWAVLLGLINKRLTVLG
jgi:hypothetical protein